MLGSREGRRQAGMHGGREAVARKTQRQRGERNSIEERETDRGQGNGRERSERNGREEREKRYRGASATVERSERNDREEREKW